MTNRHAGVLGLLAASTLGLPAAAWAGRPTRDATPPTVTLTSPPSGATFSSGQPVTLAANASDDVGVQSVRFLLDGAVLANDKRSPYTIVWTAVAGTHQVQAVATDGARNSSGSAVVSIRVDPAADTAPPSVSLTSPAAGTTISAGQSLTLAAAASDASGIARVEFLVDGASVGTDATSPYSGAWSATAGDHTVRARATDASANQNTATSATVSITVVASSTSASCGDGIVQSNYAMTSPWGTRYYEQCDDGNRRTNDGCDAYCQREFCGDGLTQPGIGEACDATVAPCTTAAGYPGTRACHADCSGFATTCTAPLSCGDAICTPGVESVASCRSDCQAVCGDGVRTGAEACDDGNLDSLDGCSAECTLDTDEAARLPVVLIQDGDRDGLDNDDVLAGLGRCAPGCILRAPAGTFRDVDVDIPRTITDGLILEGAGVDRTIFRAPAPLPAEWEVSAAVFGVIYPNRFTVFRHFTIDGRKAEQPRLPPSNVQYGIFVSNPWGTSTGPGRVEHVRVHHMLHGGMGTAYGENWVFAHNVIQDIGCSDRLPCPALPPDLRDPYVPDWQTSGFGIVTVGPQARGTVAHHNAIWNVVKIAVEAMAGAPDRLARDFAFRDNLVYNTGGGIVSNGGVNGTIAANLIEAAHSNGIACGGSAGQLVIDRNLLQGNHIHAMQLECDGDALTLSRNLTRGTCPTAGGQYGDDVLVSAGRVYGSASGLNLIGNVFGGGSCGYTLFLRGRRDIVMDGTTLQGGSRNGLLVMGIERMAISNSLIDGTHPVGILIYQDVHDLTGRVSIQNFTSQPVVILDPASTSNIRLEY